MMVRAWVIGIAHDVRTCKKVIVFRFFEMNFEPLLCLRTLSLFHGQPLILIFIKFIKSCLLYTSPSPRDRQKSRMPSSA